METGIDPYEAELFNGTDSWAPAEGYSNMQGFEEDGTEDYKRQGGPPRKRSRHQGGYSNGGGASGNGRGYYQHHNSHHQGSSGPRRAPPPHSKEVDEIAEFLAYICMNSGSSGIADMEVVARLGKFDDTDNGAAMAEDDENNERKFRKQVKKEDFFHILNFLQVDDQKECRITESQVYTSDDDKGTLQVTFDSKQECIEARYKVREFHLDLVTSFLAFDSRINVCGYENGPRARALPTDYKRKQKVKCWSFYKQRNIWRIDLLEVHSFYTTPRRMRKHKEKEDGEMDTITLEPEHKEKEEVEEEEEEEECNEEGLFPDKRNPIYEIRIQLMQEVLTSLVHTDRDNLRYIAGKFWQTIQFFAGKSAKGGRRHYGGNNNNSYQQQQHSYPPGGGNPHHYPPSGHHPQGQPRHHGGGGSGTYLSPGGPHNRGGGSPHSRSPSLSPSLSPFFSPNQWSSSSPHAPASSATPPSPLSDMSSTPFPDLQLQLVEHQMNESLRKLCTTLIKGGKEDHSSGYKLTFPGALPVNFGRRYWKLVQTKEYYVSEKTDGLRYMMLVTKDGVFLTDRSFDFYAVQGFEQLVKLYAQQGETLLDGEMVRHQTTHRPTYLVFDVLFINGVHYGGLDLSHRLQKLRDQIIVPYRKAMERGLIDKKNHPFVIIGKQFFDKKYTRKVFEHIRKEKRGGEESFYYHDEKRHHKTDGLIFTPDEPYVPFTNPKLLKWKYLEKNTIDFKLVPYRDSNSNHIPGSGVPETYLLTCKGKASQGGDIDCDIAQFLPEDTVKLKVDLQQAGQSLENLSPDANIIVECYYDVKQGQWRYCCYRREKQAANYVKTVFNTLLSVAENVGKEEIMYRVLRTAKNDEWDKQQHMVLQQHNQKKRPLPSSGPSSSSGSSSSSSSSAPSSTANSSVPSVTVRGEGGSGKGEENGGVIEKTRGGGGGGGVGMEDEEGIVGGPFLVNEDMVDDMKEEGEGEGEGVVGLTNVKDEQDQQEKLEDMKMEDVVVEGELMV